MAEPAYTKFNLTYPLAPFDSTGMVVLNVTESPDRYNPSKVSGIIAGLLIPHIICTVFIIGRVWSRLFLLRKWFLDDTLIVAGWVFSTAVCTVYSIAALTPNILDAVVISSSHSSGAGDSNGIADGSIRTYMLRTYLGLIFYQLCLCLTKLSILAFYLRMFSSRQVEFRLAQGTVVWVLLYGLPLLCMSILQCHPSPGLFFDRPIGYCFSFVPLLISSASLHAATDAWLVVLVAPCIARLDLPPRQKVALAIVLSLSILVVAASMTRLQLSLHANYRPSGAGVQVSNTLAFFVMTILECDVALMCASAPMLRPLVARLWPRLGLGDHHYDPHHRKRRQRQQQRRERLRGMAGPGPNRGRNGLGQGNGNDVDEDGSVNLTSVSYRGYPWTEPCPPPAGTSGVRSKNGSAVMDVGKSGTPGSEGADMSMPAPPVPAFMQRTPTTLSLRSFMSSIAPRSRGATVSGSGPREDRAGLLRDGDADGDEAGEACRRSSVGFDGDHGQYLGYGKEKRRSRSARETGTRNSLVIGTGSWGDSQESFVMGMNDPASPTRLSPVSVLGGRTYSDIRAGSADGTENKEKEGNRNHGDEK